MANYDNKLGEWFKQVDQQEQEVKARKAPTQPKPNNDLKPDAEKSAPGQQIHQVKIETPAAEAPISVVATVDSDEVVADPTPDIEISSSIDTGDQASDKLRSEEEPPQVEDFFSFLSRSGRQSVLDEEEKTETITESIEEVTPPVAEDQGKLGLSEGTGEPRPLAKEPAPEPPAGRREKLRPGPPVEIPLPPRPVPSPDASLNFKPKNAAPDVTQANWDRMPHHLQTLFGTAGEEIAQNSYKTFKETREQLIQRLLDPIISLEEAARVLNVCPTTVRRYTNRGVLKHYRTAGNQRRFKLSDVLAFMESGKRSESKKEAAGE